MNRVDREKFFHNKIWSENLRSVTDKFYSITKCSRKYYMDKIGCYGSSKRVLEYGCGPGSSAIYLAKMGANVTGIDISEVAITSAEDVSRKMNYNINFIVMNAEELIFDDSSFDMVCGTGILHHLQLDKAFSELSRILVADGSAIFLEPLGHNPLINCFRNRTPHLRTHDEHPLTLDDISMLSKYFSSVEVRYFHFASLFLIPFHKTSYFDKLLKLFDRIDRILFYLIPYLRRHAWSAALLVKYPIK